MKKLNEIVKEKDLLLKQKAELMVEHKSNIEGLDKKILELSKLEKIGLDGLDLDKIQMAEKIIYCSGNPHESCEGEKLTELAAIDIANGHPHLSRRYFGNKRYDGFYQRNDSEYGYGPRHGYIVDRISMIDESRGQVVCDEEKDACIYYLKNYQAIIKSKKEVTD